MANDEKPAIEEGTTTPSDESTSVLFEYLELFDCIGYRYKYFMAPNAQLDWFETFHVRTPLRIHEFLLQKFGGKCRHANFSKATESSPIESTASHMRTRHTPTHEAKLIHPKNVVPELISLKTRAESDVDGDEDVEMASPVAVETATSSSRVKTPEATYSSDESEEHNGRKCKRMKYDAPTYSPFTYLRRLPTKSTKKLQADAESSDEDSSDEDDVEVDSKNKRQQINTGEYSQLRYLEAIGSVLKSKSRNSEGGFAERPVRLRIAYRKHLTNQTTQFALIIYERRDQKMHSTRIRRMLDFSKCIEDDEQPTAEEIECNNVQPAVIRSNEGGEERETVATVETPTSAEIATALEEAAFTIQPPIHRTPTKSTPIPPGTPKRRPRSSHLNMSGLAPLPVTSVKKPSGSHGTPKLSAARSLRL